MKRSPKAIGTHAEAAVVAFLRTAGFPHAERAALAGTADRGDITGTPGLCWEVKAGAVARGGQEADVRRWLAETERERLAARADVGILVIVRAGYGEARAGGWWAVLTLRGAVSLLAPGRPPFPAGPGPTQQVWLSLADVCALARATGYGHPLLPIGAGAGDEPRA